MEYLNKEFVVPYLDVTVNKQTVLEYGRTHATSAAPLAVLVFVILFGIMMTLIWIYLFLRKLCSCCCGGRKRPVSTSLREPTSPMSRTGAALLDSPKGAVTNPMVDGSGQVDSRFNHMLNTQAWEANRKVYRWRYFYSCSLLLTMALLGCSLAIFLNQTKFDQSTGHVIRDVKGLFVDTSDFVCTADGTYQCEPKSVGKFIQRIRHKVVNAASSMTNFLNGVSGILPYTNTTINELQQADITLNAVIKQMDYVASNITEINKYKTWLSSSSNNGGATFTLPSAAISKPSTTTLTKASAAIATSIQNTKGVYSTVSQTVTTTLQPAIDSMDINNPDSMIKKVTDQVDQVLNKLYDVDSQINTYYRTMVDYTDKYDVYLPNKTQAMAGLFALPALFFIFFTLLNYYCTKGSVHLCCNMCVSYICLILFAIVAFLISTIAVITNTACEYRGAFIKLAPTKTFVLPGNTTVHLSPTLVNDILHCPGGINATDDNNFVDLLGVGKLFNITDKVNSGLTQVTDAQASFDPSTTINTAIKQLNSIKNITNTNVTKSVPIDTYISQLDDTIASLPPQNMNRLSASQRTKLDTTYGLGTTVGSSQFWTDFQTYINSVNLVLINLQPGRPVPAGAGTPPYTYATIGTLVDYGITGANNDLDPTSATPVTYDTVATHTYADLTTAMNNLTPYEAAVDAAVDINDVVVANLTIIEARATDIKTSIDIMMNLQASVVTTTDDINGTLYDILDEANGIKNGLTVQLDGIRNVAAFANTADEFTLCGFIGDFYTNTIEGEICGDFQTTLNGTWPAMLIALLILFLHFVTNSCYVRKPRWYLDPEEPPGIELSSSPYNTRPLSTGREVVLT